jgi:hypothetical protein
MHVLPEPGTGQGYSESSQAVSELLWLQQKTPALLKMNPRGTLVIIHLANPNRRDEFRREKAFFSFATYKNACSLI